MAVTKAFKKVKKSLLKQGFEELRTSSNGHHKLRHHSGYVVILGPKAKNERKLLEATARQCRQRGIEIEF